MTTGQQVIDRVRSDLLGGSEQRDKLSSAYFAGGSLLSLTYSVQGIGPGTRLGVGQNVFHVWNLAGALQVNVAAGEDGAPDVDAPLNTMVRVNPRYTDWAIFNEINNELAALSTLGLFQMKTHEFTYNSQFDAFNLPVTDLQREYELTYQTPSTRRDWPRLNRPRWRVDRNANLTDFPQGIALHLFAGLHSGYKVRFTYEAPFTPLANPAADVTTTGLPASAVDLLVLGAFINLAAPREVKRNQGEAQPNPRRQEQIPSGGMLRAYQGVQARHDRRVSEERARLRALWPVQAV